MKKKAGKPKTKKKAKVKTKFVNFANILDTWETPPHPPPGPPPDHIKFIPVPKFADSDVTWGTPQFDTKPITPGELHTLGIDFAKGESESKFAIAGQVAGNLKALASEMGVPVITASQKKNLLEDVSYSIALNAAQEKAFKAACTEIDELHAQKEKSLSNNFHTANGAPIKIIDANGVPIKIDSVGSSWLVHKNTKPPEAPWEEIKDVPCPRHRIYRKLDEILFCTSGESPADSCFPVRVLDKTQHIEIYTHAVGGDKGLSFAKVPLHVTPGLLGPQFTPKVEWYTESATAALWLAARFGMQIRMGDCQYVTMPVPKKKP